MLLIAALALLILAGLAEVSGLGFIGMDLLVALLFAGSAGLALVGIWRGGPRFWGALVGTLALLAFGFHVALNSGWL